MRFLVNASTQLSQRRVFMAAMFSLHSLFDWLWPDLHWHDLVFVCVLVQAATSNRTPPQTPVYSVSGYVSVWCTSVILMLTSGRQANEHRMIVLRGPLPYNCAYAI